MFGSLFFIPSIVFALLTIVFYLAISNVEKIHKPVTLTIGKLNADDIRKLDYEKRRYLRNQVALYFSVATTATILIGILFIIFGNADNGFLALPCVLISTVVGLLIALRVLKIANILKEEMR